VSVSPATARKGEEDEEREGKERKKDKEMRGGEVREQGGDRRRPEESQRALAWKCV
jgi:hypothetical protein